MKIKLKLLLGLVLAIFIKSIVFCQELTAPAQMDNIIQPSPDVASLFKFQDIPVNTYTGIPEISIPVYTISDGSISVPVSVMYHASGVKVEEASGVVGTGWSLSAGGSISRVMRGIPDETTTNGFIDASVNIFKDITDLESWVYAQDNAVVEEIVSGCKYDFEPDVFQLNVPGLSGKFFFNPNIGEEGGFSFIPYQKIDIEYTRGGGEITSWTITDKKGVKYYFDVEDIEYTEMSASGRSVSICDADPYLPSSWMLSRIKDPINNNAINFVYLPVTEKNDAILSETRYYVVDQMNESSGYCSLSPYVNTSTAAHTTYDTKKISRIYTSTAEINFNYTIGRPDYRDNTGCLLDYIVVQDKIYPNNSFNLDFEYQTINCQPTGCDPEGPINYPYLRSRVFLTGIQKSSHEISEPAYEFFYETPSLLPARNSISQDYWGYFNGETNESYTLIPSFTYLDGVNVILADRKPNFSFGKYGILTRIKYPTGGETEFEYESHDYGFIRDRPITLIEAGANLEEVTTGYKGTLINIQPFDFEVEFDQDVSLSLLFPICTCSYTLTISNESGTTVYLTQSVQQETFFLESGTYTLALNIHNLTPDDAEKNTIISVRTKIIIEDPVNPDQDLLIEAGGARIKQISTYDPVTDKTMIKEYEYRCENDRKRSSGSLAYALPEYTHTFRTQHLYYCYYDYLVANNVNIAAIGSTSGSHVGYSEVTVYEGGKNPTELLIDDEPVFTGYNGKVYEKYTSPIDYPDYFLTYYPPIVSGGSSWRHGRNLETYYYDATGNIVKEIRNTYVDNRFHDATVVGNKFYFNKIVVESDDYDEHDIARRSYFLKSQFDYLSETTTTEYPVPGTRDDSITTTIRYGYGNPGNLEVTSILKNLDNSRSEVTYYKYTNNFENSTSNDDSNMAIRKLNELLAISYPVEIKKVITESNLEEHTILQKQFDGQAIAYKNIAGTNIVYPENIYRFDDLKDYQLTSSDDFILDPSYTLENSNTYNSTGRLIQQTSRQGITTSLVWDYHDTYPVVKAENAENSEVTTAISNVLSQMGIIGIPNIIFHTNEFPDSAWELFNISLREELPEALITTYTYSPIYGITSITDPNNISTYYIYDDLGRLSLIKNDDGNILKTYEYNYQ
ncbi:MAG: hypothetical protein JXJ22_12290 [Bacteroidales bacterium]|nr:hypothetical protein [Bacteroidales bacterium]